MTGDWFVGVDLGGTTIKLAFINLYGEIQHKWEIPTDKSGQTITVDIAKSIDHKLVEISMPKSALIGIGMGHLDQWIKYPELSIKQRIWAGQTIP